MSNTDNFDHMVGCLTETFPTLTTPSLDEVPPPHSTAEDLTLEHWPPAGSFPVNVVGETYYRDALAKIAQNHDGDPVLFYCNAVLRPEGDNPHDKFAVAVYIFDLKVGHLSREDARMLRYALFKSEMERLQWTSCDAKVTGGGSYEGKQFDYSVELDFELGPEFPKNANARPKYPTIVWGSAMPRYEEAGPEEYFLTFEWASPAALQSCSIGQELDLWTTQERPHWSIRAPASIGSGPLLGVIHKSKNQELSRRLDEFRYLSVYRIRRRTLVVRGGMHCDPRFNYHDKDYARVVFVQVAADSNDKLAGFAAISYSVAKKGIPDSQLSALTSENGASLDDFTAKLMEADLIVGFGVRRIFSILERVLPGDDWRDKLWACAKKMDQSAPNEPETLAEFCQAKEATYPNPATPRSEAEVLASVLFRHNGKTTRSNTRIAYFMLAPRY